jgi:hypothetical protein
MKLEAAFDEMRDAILPLLRTWRGAWPEIHVPHTDVVHHMCAAISFEVTEEPYACMPDEHRTLAREAFLAVLAFGQLLERALVEDRAPRALLEGAIVAVREVLDELSLHVSRADDAVRRVLLEGVSLDDAVAGIRASADDHAC